MLQTILKEEEEEFDKLIDSGGYTRTLILRLFQSHNAKIIKAVCEEMLSCAEASKKWDDDERDGSFWLFEKQNEKAKQLINEIKL